MFINNKKMLGLLLAATAGTFIYFATAVPLPIPKSQLTEMAATLNNDLPIQISPDTSLRRISVSTVKDIHSLDFYYLLNTELSNVNLEIFNATIPKLIHQACTTSPTKDVLQHSTMVKYQYVTINQKTLPPITIMPGHCKGIK